MKVFRVGGKKRPLGESKGKLRLGHEVSDEHSQCSSSLENKTTKYVRNISVVLSSSLIS